MEPKQETNAQAQKEEPLVFFTISDWGNVYTEGMLKTAEAMADLAAQTPPRFILALGDNIYPCGANCVDDEKFEEWVKAFLQYPELNVPWKVILGNHDYEGEPQTQIDFTTSKFNPKGLWQMPAKNYTWTEKLADGTTVDFFGYDSNGASSYIDRSFPGHNAANTTREARVWLKGQLEKSQAKWKIVFAHHPFYTKSDGHGFAGEVLRSPGCFTDFRGRKHQGFNMEEVFVNGGVDAYFAGHEHAMEYTCEKNIHHFVNGASGAELNRYYYKLSKVRHMDWYQKDLSICGFTAVYVTSTKMTVNFVSNRGKIVHTVEIKKT